jgi:hypothetical protein
MESTTIEATKLAQDAARRYMDESAAIGRTYFVNWAASAQAGLRMAFDVQNAMIQATRTMVDATAQANRSWMDQTAESVRKGQEATAKIVAAGFDSMGSAMPKRG